MTNLVKRLSTLAFLLVSILTFRGTFASPTPDDVFLNPPATAHAGVWWHWMGSQVTREGITADLDWMQRMGITSATIFGMCDSCTPWAKRIAHVPTNGLRPFTPEWWKLFAFACREGQKRAIDIGLHNCPGYTSTGGKWIPPRLAMRRLVFNITNATEQISTTPDAIFPVYNEDKKTFELPACEARRTDYQPIATVRGIGVGHIPMGAFIQPADWSNFGLECDKMNPEAIDLHLDHLFNELHQYLGSDLPAAGLHHILLDSYEAGTPSWTPNFRAEFKNRRGYDCLDFLPILGGYTNLYTAAECARFTSDFDRTMRELYRDVLFKRMAARCRAEGLAFANEPYSGPFNPEEVAPFIDRLMTEFWFTPNKPGALYANEHAMFNTFRRADGSRHNIIEAESFTGSPENCAWTETPAALKPCGDRAWLNGVNRFILHSCPLQPWGKDIRPGVTMGRWGVHFGRNQTWAESGKAWFDYVARSQALLQWGEKSAARLDVPFSQLARAAGDWTVFFIVNEENTTKPFPNLNDPYTRWFNPTDGTITTPPTELAAHQSGFYVRGKSPARLEPPPTAYGTFSIDGGWQLSLDRTRLPFKPTSLTDWTLSKDAALKYFSGTATYRNSISLPAPTPFFHFATLTLGTIHGATATLRVNGKDCGTIWCKPWTFTIPKECLKQGNNILEIDLTNTWANRLIGDEQFPADVEFAPAPYGGNMMLSYPDWFTKGLAARPSTNRTTFTTWNYFTPTSPLIPSGLIGPIAIFFH